MKIKWCTIDSIYVPQENPNKTIAHLFPNHGWAFVEPKGQEIPQQSWNNKTKSNILGIQKTKKLLSFL